VHDVLTFLLTEFDPRSQPALDRSVGELVRETVEDAGGDLMPAGAGGRQGEGGNAGVGDPAILTAVFHVAGDAALTAVKLSRLLTDSAEAGVRMALCTGEVDNADDGEGDSTETGGPGAPGGPALSQATELLRHAAPQQILATASTAVMASPALPVGAELVDRGTRVLGGQHPPVRIYELYAGSADQGGDDQSPGPGFGSGLGSGLGLGGTARDRTAASTTSGWGSLGVGGTLPDAENSDNSNLEWARRAARGPVLGREEPLDALTTAWKCTNHGDRRTVLLSGEGGIGKTTVAAELALRLHADGALVLYGRWDQRALAPYQAIREALGTYASDCPTTRLRTDLEGWGDEITRLLPDVGARVGGVRAPLMGDPDGERMRLFEAIEAWLHALSRRKPVLLVLDDLHWAERSSLLLVRHLRDALAGAPVMIVATLRGDEADEVHEALDLQAHAVRTHATSTSPTGTGTGAGTTRANGNGSHGNGNGRAVPEGEGILELIELGGLERTAVAHLVEQAIGRPLDDADDDLVEWLSSETAGNPLFVQEVLRSVSGSRDAAAALRQAREEVPDRLTDVVRWRLQQLPPQTRSVLADAAVIGTTFDLDLLAGTTGTAPVSLNAPLSPALRSGLLRLHAPGERYAFAHEVVQRALRDDLGAERAANLHRRIAVTLEARAKAPVAGGQVSPAEIAYHYLEGADPATAAQAVTWARRAAEAARRETAFEAAVLLLEKAVAVHDDIASPFAADGGPDAHTALACELRLELAEALDRAGEFKARNRRHREAAERAEALGRTDLYARAALNYLGRLPQAPPLNLRARGLLETALEQLPEADSRMRALLLARLAHVRYFDASYDERRARSDEAVDMARRLGTPVVIAHVLMSRCLTLDGPDDHDEQLAVGVEVSRIGDQTGDPDLTLQGQRLQIGALMVLGRHDEARRLARTFTQTANRVRHPDHLRIAAMWQVLGMSIEGRYDEAEALAESLRRRLVASGHSQGQVIHFIQSFGLRWLRGNLDHSRSALDELEPLYSGWESFPALKMWLEAGAGNPERAVALLPGVPPEQYLDDLRHDFMWWPSVIALRITVTDPATVQPDWAAALFDRLTAYRGHNVVVGYAGFFGSVDHHLGVLALALDRIEEAVDLLGSGIDQHRALGAEPFRAYSSRWLEMALRRRDRDGDGERADRLRAESDQLADRYGLAQLPS
jgi:hypothetical protein